MDSQNTPPFQMHLEQDSQGRISRKIEYVAGRDPRVRNYEYDDDGQLAAVSDESREIESYEYDENGHRIAATWYEPEVETQKLVYQEHYTGETRLCAINNRSVYHDDNGFRESWYPHSGEEHYEYAPDYRLLKLTKTGPDRQPMTLEFDHDQNGQRCEKYVNGQLVELYDWHDLVRLHRTQTHGQDLEFYYEEHENVPYAAMLNGEHVLYLYFDQIGSLRVVADENGNVVKEVRYTAFGVIEEDSNPGLYLPIGFAGGLHDRDISWVRFGYRDYDPLTARFTAKDPLGYSAGDSDLRGYCFDDPINLVDPEGLKSRKHAGPDSAEEPPNLVDKDAGADSAQPQPQPNETDWKAIQQEHDNELSPTIYGLDPGVNKGEAVRDIMGRDLRVWGETMRNAGPVIGSVIEEVGKDPEPADIPRGILKGLWITE